MPRVIGSGALYPRADDRRAFARRREEAYLQPVGDPWPEDLRPGERVVVRDSSGWEWDAELLERPEGERAEVRVLGERRALPFPALLREADGRAQVLLPLVSGHAHARDWQRGDVIELDGEYWRVRAVRDEQYRARYMLEVTTAEKYATRPGSVTLRSWRTATDAIGACIRVGSGEWLQVLKVARRPVRGAAGTTYAWRGSGRFVSAKKAARINAIHPTFLDRDLMEARCDRVVGRMPEDAVRLLSPVGGSAVSGSRVAVVGQGRGAYVLHERAGDPDRLDSWYLFIVRVADLNLVARVRKYIAARAAAEKAKAARVARKAEKGGAR